jgi:hypothetical protein
MAQTTTTKPAAKTTKPAAAKPAKTTTKPAKTTPAAAAKPAPLHYIKDSFRPGSGAALFAYTMAWLQESGLIDGGDISRSDALKFAGATAVGYHTKNGRFLDKGGRISLNPATNAANFFADRRHETETREAFRAMMRTGQPDGKLIKQAAAFGKLDA